MDRKKIILILIFFIVFLLRLPSLFEPFTYGDEGVYVTLGQAARRGLIFYRDIHDNKPPLLYFLAAVAGNFSSFRLILFLWSFVTIYAFWKLAEIILPKHQHVSLLSTFIFAILSTIHTFEGNIANAENFMMLPTILAFYLLLKKNPSYLFAGILFSLATLFKMPAGFDFAAGIVLVILLTKKLNFVRISKKILLMTIGFVFPITLTFFYYWLHGALVAYVKAAFLQNIGYLSSWSGDKPKAFSLPILLLIRGGIVFAVFGVLFFLRKKLSTKVKLTSIWFAFALFGALLSGRPYPHYLLQPIVPLSLASGFVILKQKERVIPFLLVAAFIFNFAFFKFWRYENMSYYQNFYLFLVDLKSREDYFRYFGDQTENLYKAAAYIKSHTQEKEKVFVWGNQPSFYALANRSPVGKYTVAYHIIDYNGWQETLKTLQSSSPRYIVITGDENRSFPGFISYLVNNYRPDADFGKIKIFRRQILLR